MEEERIYSTIIGGAIGDALGVPVEFEPRDTVKVSGMIGHGTHNQPKGTWSDDTSLTLCLMENLIEGGDDKALMNKFSEYLKHGYMTPHGECFDIGGTTIRAIDAFRKGAKCGQSGENDNGNGSLMRIAPVAFLNIKDDSFNSRLKKVEQYSSLTHAHPRSILGCVIYIEYLRQLYYNKDKIDALKIVTELCFANLINTSYQLEFDYYDSIFSKEIANLERSSINSTGYVVYTLEAALWCFLKNDNYRGTVLEAVNLGGDTDTIGIVAGSMAGMFYGLNGIPDEWVNSLVRIEYIKEMCRKFADFVNAKENGLHNQFRGKND